AEAAHVTANLDHSSGDLVSQYARHLHAKFQRAVARDYVVKAHATRIDLYDYILWPRRRIGNLFDLEDINATRHAHHHRLHWCSFRGLKLQQSHVRRDVLEHGLNWHPDAERAGLDSDWIGEQPDAAIESHLDHRIWHAKTVEVGSMENAPRLDDANRHDRMPFGCLRPALRAEPRGRKSAHATISAALDAHLAAAQRPPERLIRSIDVRQRSHDGSLA